VVKKILVFARIFFTLYGIIFLKSMDKLFIVYKLSKFEILTYYYTNKFLDSLCNAITQK
jgi:hypothetical protein